MPTFDVTIQSKKYHVDIPDPGARPLQVIVDGQTFDVEFSGVETSARPAQPLAEAPRPAPGLPALPPRPAPGLPVLPPMPNVKVARPVAPAGASGGYGITSPMPGTLLSIDVQVGDAIEPGQVVCVLEAMKMKNSIRASVSGTVSEILASVGQVVAHGDVLVRLTTGA
jgi:biotin carboxyl carrier protein